MVLAQRLLTAHQPFPPVATFPSSWGLARYVSNPVIAVAGGEAFEQYDPAPIKIGSDIWCYIKGAIGIYAYKSTDDGVTFVAQNGGSWVIAHGAGGAWDSTYALEPAVQYDGTTIRAWYKGSNGGAPGWGYATAPGGTPTIFTKDAGNPILTATAISTQMGGLTVADTAPFDVVLVSGTYHFYGYVQYDGTYQIVHMTGSDWNAPDVSTLTVLLAPGVSSTIAATGSVFRVPGIGTPQYGMFYTWGPLSASGRTIRIGRSFDLVTWDFTDTTDIMSPTSGWESYHVYTPRLLRVATAPCLLPVVDGSNRWKLYYSGADASWVHSQTGLAYLTPSA